MAEPVITMTHAEREQLALAGEQLRHAGQPLTWDALVGKVEWLAPYTDVANNDARQSLVTLASLERDFDFSTLVKPELRAQAEVFVSTVIDLPETQHLGIARMQKLIGNYLQKDPKEWDAAKLQRDPLLKNIKGLDALPAPRFTPAQTPLTALGADAFAPRTVPEAEMVVLTNAERQRLHGAENWEEVEKRDPSMSRVSAAARPRYLQVLNTTEAPVDLAEVFKETKFAGDAGLRQKAQEFTEAVLGAEQHRKLPLTRLGQRIISTLLREHPEQWRVEDFTQKHAQQIAEEAAAHAAKNAPEALAARVAQTRQRVHAETNGLAASATPGLRVSEPLVFAKRSPSAAAARVANVAAEGAEAARMGEIITPTRMMTREQRVFGVLEKMLSRKRMACGLYAQFANGDGKSFEIDAGHIALPIAEIPELKALVKERGAIQGIQINRISQSGELETHLVPLARMQTPLGRVLGEKMKWLEPTIEQNHFWKSLKNAPTSHKIGFAAMASVALLSFLGAYQNFSSASYEDEKGKHFRPSALMWGAFNTIFGAAMAYSAVSPHLSTAQAR